MFICNMASALTTATSLLHQISILEAGHRRALLDMQLIREVGADELGLKMHLSPGSGDAAEAMYSAVEKLRLDLQARRAQVGALVGIAAATAKTKDIDPIMAKLSAWLQGSVEGNITPQAGTLTLEVALKSIKEARNPGHRKLLILGVRAFKLVNGAEKLAEVERGVRERVNDGSGLGPIKFTEEQRAAATVSFDTKLLPEVEKLEAEVSAAAAISKVAVSDVGILSQNMQALRVAVTNRATGLPIASVDAVPVVQGVPVDAKGYNCKEGE